MHNNYIVFIIAAAVIVFVVAGGLFYLSSRPASEPKAEDNDNQDNSDNASGNTGQEVNTTNNANSNADNLTIGKTPIKEFTVTASNYKFDVTEIVVTEGDRVRINFINGGGFHDWVLDEFNARTAQTQTGERETIEFIAGQKGEFEFYCSVGNHREMGMAGKFVVN